MRDTERGEGTHRETGIKRDRETGIEIQRERETETKRETERDLLVIGGFTCTATQLVQEKIAARTVF